MAARRIRKFVMRFYELWYPGQWPPSVGDHFPVHVEQETFPPWLFGVQRRDRQSSSSVFIWSVIPKIHLNFMSAESQTFIWGRPLTPGDVVGYHPLPLSCGTWPKHLYCGWPHRGVMVLSWMILSQLSCSNPRLCSYQLQGTKLCSQSPTFQYLLYNSCATVVRQACINTTSSWKPSKPVSTPDSVWHLDMTVNGNLQVPQMDRK